MDKTNLTPGILDEALREEVQASKFLIVICSRAAAENSKYLDIELQHFLDGGGDNSRVIHLIVEKSEHPVSECFPTLLREICRENSTEERPVINADRYTTTEGTYHEKGRLNEYNQLMRQCYYGPDEEPVMLVDLYHRGEFTYDHRFNRIKEVYYDTEDRVVARFEYTYDEYGNRSGGLVE